MNPNRRKAGGPAQARMSRRIREVLSDSQLSQQLVVQLAYDLGDAHVAVKRADRALRMLVGEGPRTRRWTSRRLEELLGELIVHLPYHIAHLRRTLPRAIVSLEGRSVQRRIAPAQTAGRASRRRNR